MHATNVVSGLLRRSTEIRLLQRASHALRAFCAIHDDVFTTEKVAKGANLPKDDQLYVWKHPQPFEWRDSTVRKVFPSTFYYDDDVSASFNADPGRPSSIAS